MTLVLVLVMAFIAAASWGFLVVFCLDLGDQADDLEQRIRRIEKML